MSPALLRYSVLLLELFQKRRGGALSDDEEERFAGDLTDCRAEMEPGEEDQIGGLIERARAKIEGWREGMLAAKKACQEASAGHSNPTAKRAALNCAEHIDALLLASSEAKEPANGCLLPRRGSVLI